MKKRIAVVAGDGVGPEIVGEAIKVLHAIGDRFGHEFEIDQRLIGGCAYDATGKCLRFGCRLKAQPKRHPRLPWLHPVS